MLQFGDISLDSILWFFASGRSYFLGLLMLILILIIPLKYNTKWERYFMYFLRTVAVLLVILSSTPLHPLLYIIGLILLIGASLKNKKTMLFKIIFVSFALLAILLELPFHKAPNILIDDVDCIYVIGDSVSAGMGKEGEQTWPALLERQTGIKTINLARAGATAESALKQASLVSDKNSIIILEIGGNDLLGHTPLDTFASSSGELLEKVGSCKQVIWLELPLLPQYYPYGRIQRKLAKQHNIILVPKSVLANIFGTEGATSDGIHLNRTGHETMALEMQKLIKKGEIE